MYGFGFGLSKMMEGVTGGAAKGMLNTMVLDQERKDREALQEYRQKTLEQGRQRIDNEEDRIRIKQSADAFRIAYDIAKDSPDPQITFGSIYKNLNPEGELPQVMFSEKDMEINFKGVNIKGSRQHIRQALDIISRKPEITPQVMQKLVELGLAKITVEKPETDKGYGTFSPGAGIFSKDTGKVITPADASKSASSGATYGKDKLIDDTRGYYTMLLKALMDPEGNWVRPGKEQEYADIMKNMNADLARIERGEKPSWLTGGPQASEKVLDAETAKKILQEAGGDKGKARELATQRGFKF